MSEYHKISVKSTVLKKRDEFVVYLEVLKDAFCEKNTIFVKKCLQFISCCATNKMFHYTYNDNYGKTISIELCWIETR